MLGFGDVHSCRLTFHDLWRNHCKRVYYLTGSTPVFQHKRKFSFARLLRSLRSDWEDVKCKSNIFWVLVFESILMHCWIKKISVSHFSPASRPLRTPASRPFLSRLPYPSRPLFSRAPAPLSSSTLLLLSKQSSGEEAFIGLCCWQREKGINN